MKSYTRLLLILSVFCIGLTPVSGANARRFSGVSASITASATVINPLGVLSITPGTLLLMAPPDAGLSIDINNHFLVGPFEYVHTELLDEPQRLRDFQLDEWTREQTSDPAEPIILTVIYTEN